jgi:hypothetical protein
MSATTRAIEPLRTLPAYGRMTLDKAETSGDGGAAANLIRKEHALSTKLFIAGNL